MLEWAGETILVVPRSVFPKTLSLKYTINYHGVTTALDFSSNILFSSNALYSINFYEKLTAKQ